MSPRSSGLLLHPTCLPGRFGIGDLGPSARAFVGFLRSAGQGWWQVLPLAPTGYGDSPYQGLGAFAGNPLLISPEELCVDGLVRAEELEQAASETIDSVDYGEVIARKGELLHQVSQRFDGRASETLRRARSDWEEHHRDWLDDFALFSALKEHHRGRPWWEWDAPLANRHPAALAQARSHLEGAVRTHALAQFLFWRQWHALRAHAHRQGISLLGDLPIYVASDSAEVWARRDLFQLDERGRPTFQAGVPPDYFSHSGQLWGNPLYRWDDRRDECLAFVASRFRAALEQVDRLRLDHFRGYQAYWAVPGGARTAEGGSWHPGPGAALLEKLRAVAGSPSLPAVAENLGVITPEVEALREAFDLPGMAILQFGFGTDPQGPSFLPHNYTRDLVAFTGTHDNDTVMGWWKSAGGDSTRTEADICREKDFACHYLDTDGEEMNWVMIRAVLGSVAGVSIFPLQDVLGLGSEARMNRPGTSDGNWRWRVDGRQLTSAVAERLGALTSLYGRA